MIRKWASSFVVTVALAPALASAARYNLQTPQTVVAREIYDLHTLIFVICCVIFVVVFGAMIYSIIKHRQAAGHKAEQFHENVKVEIAWAIIPFLILIGMVYPATKTVISRSAVNPDYLLKDEQSGSGADRQADPRHYHHPHSGSSAIPRSAS